MEGERNSRVTLKGTGGTGKVVREDERKKGGMKKEERMEIKEG